MYICEFCSLVGNVSGGGASTHSHTIQVQGERANPWQKPPLSHTEANPASMELHSDSGSDTYRWTINRHCWNYLLIEHALYHYFSSISPSFTYTLHCVGIGFCLSPVVVYTNYTVIGRNKDGPANVFGHWSQSGQLPGKQSFILPNYAYMDITYIYQSMVNLIIIIHNLQLPIYGQSHNYM